MRHQQHEAPLEPAPLTVADAIAQVAKWLRRSVPDLSRADRQFLDDVQRGRYPLTAEARLIALSRRSTLDHHATALGDQLAGLVLVGRCHQALDVAAAFKVEGWAQYEGDEAQRAYAFDPTDANRTRAIATLAAHATSLHHCVRALAGPPAAPALRLSTRAVRAVA